MPGNADYRLYLESEFKALNDKLTSINDHLDQLNGSVTRHEIKISENLPHSVVHCVQKATIEELRDELTGKKALERRAKDDKEDRRASAGRWVVIIGIAVSIILGVFNILRNKAVPADVAITKKEIQNLGTPFITNNRGEPVVFNDTTKIYYWPTDSAYMFIITKVKNKK
ncbi:MAG: hypothetical protein UR43_C0015G0009 [candidate division TM6 bacterium GW2011_GWF2_33_332]|nr:MAG: hypothetical protein UR43_C0015G0009 [candidate division TM6 bacterium GW2011_GWF2_33_332]